LPKLFFMSSKTVGSGVLYPAYTTSVCDVISPSSMGLEIFMLATLPLTGAVRVFESIEAPVVVMPMALGAVPCGVLNCNPYVAPGVTKKL